MAKGGLATEVERLKAQIAALKEARDPPKWVVVEVMPDEDKSAEIAAIEAEGHRVFIREIIRPKPVSDDDELPAKFQKMADDEARLRMLATKEEERYQKELEASRVQAKLDQLTGHTERPFPLKYPKQVF